MEKIKTRVKELRLKTSTNPKELADLLNLTLQSYYRYETGENEPTIGRLIQLADFFNVPIDYLVGRKFSNDFGFLTKEQSALFHAILSLDEVKQVKIAGYVAGLMS